MALNKAKVLKSAEKYVIQGKISHAIPEYQKLIKEDPTDLPLVNTLGDLYVRIGNIPEAVNCFTKLAESYDNGGFVVRAIAMYKKVSKIDPGQIQALSRLADLYLRQGLISDARAHYLQVADNLLKRNENESAVAILRKIIEVDPDNPAVEARLAEICLKLGEKSEAARAFHSAAQKYKKKGALEDAENFLRKASQLDENDAQILLSYAEVVNDLGRTDEALSQLNRIQFHDFNPEVHETAFNIYLKAGRWQEAEKTATHLIELDSNYFRLHLSLAKSYTEHGDLDHAVSELSRVLETAVKRSAGEAIETQLKAILHKDPEHMPCLLELVRFYNTSNAPHNLPSLLEEISNLYVRRGQYLEAASILTELVRLEPNDPSHRENLRQIKERLGLKGEDIDLPRLVPDMSAIAEKFVSEPTLKTIASEGTAAEETDEEAPVEVHSEEQVKGFIVEGDLFASYGLYPKAIDQYKKVLEVVPSHIEIHEKIRDMYAKSGALHKAAQECLVLANIFTARNDPDNANKNFTLAYQYDPNLHREPIYKDLSASGVDTEFEIVGKKESVPKTTFDKSAAASVDRRRLGELLEEIDFYLDQGFLAEAKSCIDDYAGVAPNDLELLKRLERYQALSGVQSNQAQKPEMVEIIVESEASSEQPAGVIEKEFETVSANDGPSGAGVEKETTAVIERTETKGEPATAISSTESFEEIMIDLDQELENSSLEKVASQVPSNALTGAPGTEALSGPSGNSSLEDVFAEFKAGLEDEESDVPDYETHYNLGIAFKEMGLLEEAIAEFQKALKDCTPENGGEEFVRCCNMLGLCFLEKGLPQVAIKWFTKGLSSPGRDEETYQALRYDLGCAHEQAGNTKAALETFLDVYGMNINYRDVAGKIRNLKKSL